MFRLLFGAGSRNLKEAPNVPLGADEFQAVNWSLPLSQRWAQKCGWYARGANLFGAIVKALQDKFSSGGWDYNLIERTERYFIYSKTAPFCERESFEVFQRRIAPAGKFVRDGVEVVTEEKESFPKDTHFGKWAWSSLCIEDAKATAEKIELHSSVIANGLA